MYLQFAQVILCFYTGIIQMHRLSPWHFKGDLDKGFAEGFGAYRVL